MGTVTHTLSVTRQQIPQCKWFIPWLVPNSPDIEWERLLISTTNLSPREENQIDCKVVCPQQEWICFARDWAQEWIFQPCLHQAYVAVLHIKAHLESFNPQDLNLEA